MKDMSNDKADRSSQERTLEDLLQSVLMDLYFEKSPDPLEKGKIKKEIETFISDVKQALKRELLPLEAGVKLAENQVVLCDDLSENDLNAIVATDDVDDLVNDREVFQKQIKNVIEKLGESRFMIPYRPLYLQTLGAYESDAYDLAVLGFFAIIDGVLSDITKAPKSVAIVKRVEKIIDAENFRVNPSEEAIDESIKKLALLKVSELLAEYIPFNKCEPNALNRHWAMHGRSRTRKTKTDCDKLILFLHRLLNITESY